ncbi:TrmH family RNA methyltransferase [Chitinophaga skermanii]|uniref:TrmH family RNA methyltransferase n=1 Tax=Chitinophaga skermanii TaxID=331697 RepID=A0A327Q8Z5_9BACT|nr:RNA methyltransferase [Chitinophaga skermanii]RAI99732.1 TrmH family RNA methyltransferase [Chitinophaga skermanii]
MLSKAQIKYIHALQHKKYRQKFGQFIAEGDKIVLEIVLTQPQLVTAVYATTQWLSQHSTAIHQYPAAQLHEVTETELKSISSLTTPNQAIALVNMPARSENIELANRVTIAVETLQDPGNLGTIIRIADWFGVAQVICSPGSVDPYNAKTIQATMGSYARIPVLEADLAALFQTNTSIPVYAATLHGQNITLFDPIKEGVILIGNESKGLSDDLLQYCTHQITIPRIGHAESLNAAVATGIICGRLLL